LRPGEEFKDNLMRDFHGALERWVIPYDVILFISDLMNSNQG
jgi:hypothetical protein